MTYSKLEATAFLAALVATPASEPIPTLTKDLFVPDPNAFLEAAEKDTAGSLFWKNYSEFHQKLFSGYRGKERNKILEPPVSSDDSDKAAKKEIPNESLSAEEIITSANPNASAQASFQASQQEALDWSITLTQWQP